jgi:hypothetical protein
LKSSKRLNLVLSGLFFFTALIIIVLAWPSFQHAEIVVQWTTASELDTAGFNIYRSDAPDGEFVRVNANIVPASPDPFTGGSYEFKDQNVIPGRTYYYILEDIDNNGVANRSKDVVKAKAERGGQTFILLSIVLAGSGLFVLVRTLRLQRIHTNSQFEEI